MLITAPYIKEQLLLHQDPSYGAGSHRYDYLVAGIMQLECCESVLDYGAGKGTLADVLRKSEIDVAEYDPCVAGKDQEPEPADLVTCIDVMEHIEPDCLDDVIRHLARLSKKRLFVDVATKFDKHRWLSDGRNAHMVANEPAWWEARFKMRGFKVHRTWNNGFRAWIALMSC